MPPTEEQMLQAEHENLLSPEEQQALNELRDVGGIGPALAVVSLRERGMTRGVKRMQPLGGAPAASAPPAPGSTAAPEPSLPGAMAPTEPPIAPQQASPSPGLGQALWDSLGAGGRRAEAMVGNIADDPMAYLRSVLALTQGPEGLSRGIAGGALEPAKYAFPPALAGEVAGGTGMRMAGGTPDQVRAAEEAGGVVGGLGATVGPSLLRGGARLLSPSLRGQEKVASIISKAAPVAETMAPIGSETATAVEGIGSRLTTDAMKRARTATSYEKQFSPQTLRAEKQLAQGQGKPLTEKDYSTNLLELRKTSERAGDAALAFDRNVTRRLANVSPSSIPKKLAGDPDLLAAIRAHASPEEMAIIDRALTAGKSLGKMQYTAEELTSLGQAMAQGKGILSPLVHWGVGGAGLGYLFGAGMPAVTGAAIGARLGLKALDALIASRPGAAGLRVLAQMQPGTQDVARALGALGGELGGPLKLEPRD